MNPGDEQYEGLPFKAGGRTREGCDCAGLVRLFLAEQMGLKFDAPATPASDDDKHSLASYYLVGREQVPEPEHIERGDVVFFKSAVTGKICHVAVALGQGRFLHTANGLQSRIENGFELLRRGRRLPAAVLKPSEVDRLNAALGCPEVKDWGVALFIIGIGLSAISALLLPKKLGNSRGRYGFDGLVTQNSPEIPLPDILGEVTVAGNSPYTQLAEKGASATPASQKANKVVILASGPVQLIDYPTGLLINGITYADPYFKDTTEIDGFVVDPAQTKDEAVTGTISGESDVPSISLYDGAHGIEVPVDIRAHYDRTFPIYGFSGCSYAVFRLIDSSKFSNFNVTARVRGRLCRTFDSSGFVTGTSTAEAVGTGDGSTVRFKLDYEDIAAVSSVTVNGVTFTEMTWQNQSGNVYHVNKLKGYLEFPTAPTSTHAIVATYTYYVRAWTQNPASQIVYLLTEKGRGKGLDESQIDWARAVTARDHFDDEVEWKNSSGVLAGARFKANYALDYRKPIQEHIQALLDSCNAYLFTSGGKWVIKPRIAGSSVFSFTTSNILAEAGGGSDGRSTFQAELMDRSDRPNRIKLYFHDEKNFNAESEVIADDKSDQEFRQDRAGNNGVVDANIKLPAVTSQDQAERIAHLILQEQVNGRLRATLKTNIQGLNLEPGDIVDVTHPAMPGWTAKSFWIEDASYDPDDYLSLTLAEYVPGAFS